uniref:Kinetochore protein NDC80 n=1 Tax=Trichobilharzia regenti TaxID=157069 RepID=A0AA85J5J6_TRIRE|nr:unnamed protein product [Trichobilharzia regenti]
MRRNYSLQSDRKSRQTRAPSVVGQEQKSVNRDVKYRPQPNEMVESLMQFLVNTDYCSSTPEASLTLNSKEIFSIFEHVIRQIDPSFRIKGGVMKPEEVLVSTLKKLGYPNPLSKLHLVAPGAPQAWNSIVTALNWLREGVEHAKQLSEFSIPVAEGDGNANEKASVNKLIHELKLSLFKKKRGDPNITDSVIQNLKSSISITLGAPSDEDMKKAYDRSIEKDIELASFESNCNEENVLKKLTN